MAREKPSQHKPGQPLHASTLWRRRKKEERRKKDAASLEWSEYCKSFDKKSGARPVDVGEENEILGFAAGVIDKLNESGAFSPAHLSVPVYGPHKPGHESRRSLIHGSAETVEKLRATGFPVRLILYCVGLLYAGFTSDKFLKNKKGKTADLVGFGAYYTNSSRLEAAAMRMSRKEKRNVSIPEAIERLETEHLRDLSPEKGKDKKLKIASNDDSENYIDAGGKENSQYSLPHFRAPAKVYKMPGFSKFISRTAVYYWDKRPTLQETFSSIYSMIQWEALKDINKEPSGSLDLKQGLYRRPMLSDALNAPFRTDAG